MTRKYDPRNRHREFCAWIQSNGAEYCDCMALADRQDPGGSPWWYRLFTRMRLEESYQGGQA